MAGGSDDDYGDNDDDNLFIYRSVFWHGFRGLEIRTLDDDVVVSLYAARARAAGRGSRIGAAGRAREPNVAVAIKCF